MRKKLETHMIAAAKGAHGALGSRYGIWVLGIISFVESILLIPLITDPFLLAYIAAKKKDAVRAVLVTTFSSVLGGVAAYFVAAGFFEVFIAQYFNESTLEELHTLVAQFEEGVFLLTLTGALTPLPYTLVAVAAGLVQANLLLFIGGSLLGRIIRYSTEGWLTYKFGDRAMEMIRKQIVAAAIVCAVLIIVYLIIKL